MEKEKLCGKEEIKVLKLFVLETEKYLKIHFFLGLRDLLGTSGFPLAILVQEFP